MWNVGQWDQFHEAQKDMAKILKNYYDALIAVGFKEEQAIQLVTNFQTMALHNPSK